MHQKGRRKRVQLLARAGDPLCSPLLGWLNGLEQRASSPNGPKEEGGGDEHPGKNQVPPGRGILTTQLAHNAPFSWIIWREEGSARKGHFPPLRGRAAKGETDKGEDEDEGHLLQHKKTKGPIARGRRGRRRDLLLSVTARLYSALSLFLLL